MLTFQLAAVVIKLNDILDTPFDQLLIEGLGDQVGDAKTVNLDTEPFARFCGNHDDWNIMVFIFSRDLAENVNPVHLGHDVIQQHDRYRMVFLFQNIQRHPAIFRFQDLVFFLDRKSVV